MTENEWKQKCDESANEWKRDDTILYHSETLEDAIFIRKYMEKKYPHIPIFIVVKGFVYNSTTMKNIAI